MRVNHQLVQVQRVRNQLIQKKRNTKMVEGNPARRDSSESSKSEDDDKRKKRAGKEEI